VAGKIVQHHQVTPTQARGQEAFAKSREAQAVEGTVQNHRSACAVQRDGVDQGGGLPVSARARVYQAFALFGPAAESTHVGLEPGFIDEHEPLGIDFRLRAAPVGAGLGDIRTSLLGGPQRLFL